MQRSLLHVARITTSDLLQCPAAQGLRVMGPLCSQNRVPRYLKGRLEPSIRTTVPKNGKRYGGARRGRGNSAREYWSGNGGKSV